ncbi:hypothetical protein D3C86_1771880 [compost metagenome]
MREDGRRHRQGGSVREGGGRQEARRGGQEQLRAKVRQDHLNPWVPGVSALGRSSPEGGEGPSAPLLLWCQNRIDVTPVCLGKGCERRVDEGQQAELHSASFLIK